MAFMTDLGDLDHPKCLCGRFMRLATVIPQQPKASEPFRGEVHTFECASCRHELRVLHDIPSPPLAKAS
jgi:hypothetical protein